MNKKVILIVLGAISVIILFFVYFIFRGVNKTDTMNIISTMEREGYLKKNDVGTCFNGSEIKDCLLEIDDYLKNGIEVQLFYINKSADKQLEKNLEKSYKYANTGDAIGFEKNLNIILESKNKIINDYLVTNGNDIVKIKEFLDKTYEATVVNVFVDGNYAVATLDSIKTDSANLVLKKESSWRVISGPGTDFDRKELEELKISETIIERISLMYKSPVIKYKISGFNDDIYIGSIINYQETKSELPLKNKLPVFGDVYNISVGLLNGKEYYRIDVFYTTELDKETNKKEATDWFKKKGINYQEYPHEFQYLLLDKSA